MKTKWLIGTAIVFLLLNLLLFTNDDKGQDKNKKKPQPKQITSTQPKPAPKPQPKHPTPSMPLNKGTAPFKSQPAGQQQLNGNRPPSLAVIELQRRMNAPVNDSELDKARNQYLKNEFGRYKMQYESFRMRPEHVATLKQFSGGAGTYFHRRAIFYDSYGYTPPTYIYDLSPSYGMWDARFLAFMLDRIVRTRDKQYVLFYYNNMKDQGLKRWRNHVNKLAAKNAELKDQLAILDQEVARLNGTPQHLGYIPEEVGDVALSPQLIDKSLNWGGQK